MKAGDIITHAYENVTERMPVVDENGKLRPFVLDARKRGILFNVGHGGVGFWFNQAVPYVKQGLAPDTFGTDMHYNSVNSGRNNCVGFEWDGWCDLVQRFEVILILKFYRRLRRRGFFY